MATYQCKVCLGVYQSPQRDKTSYYHACAPIHNAAYDGQFTIDPQGVPVPNGPLNPTIPEMLERPAKRDENPVIQPSGKTAPKSDGAGKDTLP